MDRICDYCKCQFDDSLDKCPHCGAPNSYVRRGEGVPRTIGELKQWYIKMGLPSEDITRFFIGKNVEEPKNFGIYQDPLTDNFVVYKNKANGERAIRYQGTDESYAVNEFYLRLKEEMLNQKLLNQKRLGDHAEQSEDKDFKATPNADGVYRREDVLKEESIRHGRHKYTFKEVCDGVLQFILLVVLFLFLTYCTPLPDIASNIHSAVVDVCDNVKIRLHGSEYLNDDGTYDWDSYYHDERIKEYESEESGWDSLWSGDSWDSGGTDWDSDW